MQEIPSYRATMDEMSNIEILVQNIQTKGLHTIAGTVKVVPPPEYINKVTLSDLEVTLKSQVTKKGSFRPRIHTPNFVEKVDGLYIVEAKTVETNAKIYDRYITKAKLKAKFGEQHKTVKEFCDEYWKKI